MHSVKRVLLVEDDEDDQYFFIEALKNLYPHIQCQIAENGAEALKAIDQYPPFDLIFHDLNMPKVNGFGFLKVLKSDPVHKHIPAIVISTSNQAEDVDRSMQLGAAAYICKPPSFEAFFQKVQRIVWVERHRLIIDNIH